MTAFKEMIAKREQEHREFAEKYEHNPEKLAADLSKAIQALEAKGYIVRKYDNYDLGKRSEVLPVAYEIMRDDYSTVYGYGTCDEEQVMRFAASVCDTSDEAESRADEAEPAPLYGDNQEKEREYDLTYNEGAEGYNPYRIWSAPTYRIKQ